MEPFEAYRPYWYPLHGPLSGGLGKAGANQSLLLSGSQEGHYFCIHSRTGSQFHTCLCFLDDPGMFYHIYQRYWRWVLLACVVTGLLSKPLGLLNNLLLSGMWKIIRWIL